jgi:hypothetical protein
MAVLQEADPLPMRARHQKRRPAAPVHRTICACCSCSCLQLMCPCSAGTQALCDLPQVLPPPARRVLAASAAAAALSLQRAGQGCLDDVVGGGLGSFGLLVCWFAGLSDS